MRVSGVTNSFIIGYNSNPSKDLSFNRRLRQDEEKDYHDSIIKSYEVIGAYNRAVITHGSVYPALGRDTNIGSPFGKSAENLNSFYYLHGFNSVQLGPIGELEHNSNSPYNASAFAKNRMFIDLEQLTQPSYANILSTKTYKAVTNPIKNTEKNYTDTEFEKAYDTYNEALSEAYINFNKLVKAKDPKIAKLNKEYKAFIKKHDERLTDEGIFKVLAEKYSDEFGPNEDFNTWEDEQDRNLIIKMRNGDIDALMRYNDLVEDPENADVIEKHKFEQFIATKQIKENKEFREKIGRNLIDKDDPNYKDKIKLEYINDLLVGCSQMDAWRYQDAFMQDWEMGAKESGKPSQRWHIPIIDPKQIFKNDKYELNRGGQFLKEKIDFALEFCENIRVDHAMGLIEPYIMYKHAEDEDFDTNPPHEKNKNIEMYISELKNPKRKDGQDYDKYWDYPKLLKHLVIPTLKEHKIDVEKAVWEDIYSYPDRFKQIYEKDLKLPKLKNLDWERSENVFKEGRYNDWFIVGSHDNEPVMNYFQRIGNYKDKDGKEQNGEYTRYSDPWNTEYLAGYLNMDDSRPNIEQIRKDLAKLYETNDRERVFAKFAELMTTPKFQISFDDLFGITEEGVVYNIPGTDRYENWRERLTPDCIDKYYENLSSKNPTAINVPETLRKALQAKIDMEVKAHNYDDGFKRDIYNKCQPLLDKLDYYAQILKEPEKKSTKTK